MILIFFFSFEHVRMPFSQCFNNHHKINGKTMEWIKKRHTNSKRSWMWKRAKKMRWKEGHKENKKLRKCQWKTSIRQKEQWHEWEKTDVRLCERFLCLAFWRWERQKTSNNKSFCLRINKCTCYSQYSEYHRLWQRIFNQMPLYVSTLPLQSQAVRVCVCTVHVYKAGFFVEFLALYFNSIQTTSIEKFSEDIQIRILFTKTNKSKIIARFVFHAHESTLYWKTYCM